MRLISRFTLSIAVFIISMVLYSLTLAPGVTFIDSGELAAVCSTLGISHPSGYPLFTLLGFLWTHIPLPLTKIFMLNLMAAISTAASCVVFFNIIYMVIKYLSHNRIEKTVKQKQKPDKIIQSYHSTIPESRLLVLSFIVAQIYSFSLTVWAQSNAIEVYSLQLLLFNLILLTFLKAITATEKKIKWFFGAAFIIGLGFSNHLTTMFILPALLFLFLKQPQEPFVLNKDKLKILTYSLVFMLLGMSFYLYLPIRSASLPEFNWGWVHRSISKFYYHFQGKQYQVWMFSGSEVFLSNFMKFLKLLPYQFAVIGLIPMIWGFVQCFKICKELFWFFIVIILFYLLYTLNYSIPDIDNYFLPVFIPLIIFTAIGIWSIIDRFPKTLPAFIIIPLISLFINYPANDESNDCLVEEYTRIMIDNLEPNAIIFSAEWDYFVSAFWYLQKVEGLRPDIVLIDKELLRRTWYIEQLRRWYPEIMSKCEAQTTDFMKDLELFESKGLYDYNSIQPKYENMINCLCEQNFETRPVYVTFDALQNEQNLFKSYIKQPSGFALHLVKDDKIPEISLDKIDLTKFISSLKSTEGRLVDGIRAVAATNLVNIGRYAASKGMKDKSKDAFGKALSVDPKNKLAKEGMQALENVK
jgi:hypothetical protein